MAKEFQLPIMICGECDRLTIQEQGVPARDSMSPVLCDVCGQATEDAWNFFRDAEGRVSPEELAKMLPQFAAKYRRS